MAPNPVISNDVIPARRTPINGDSSPLPPSRGWIAGMALGQAIGFALAVVFAPPAVVLPALMTAVVAGGYIGSLAGARRDRNLFLQNDKKSRSRDFRALLLSAPRVHELDIDNEFNDAAANSNGPRQKQEAKLQPKLAVPMPMMMRR